MRSGVHSAAVAAAMPGASRPVEFRGRAEEGPAHGARAASAACFHCGTACPDDRFTRAEKVFCCHGCLTVFELLTENGLGHFYDLGAASGVRVPAAARAERFRYLDEPAVRQSLVDFSDGRSSRVTFHVPAVHCLACVWLLENLFRLHPGVEQSRVNFPRREVSITFAEGRVSLSDVALLLASLGYEPALTLGHLEQPAADPAARRLAVQLGVAGFAFGNIMLFSLPSYLGLDAAQWPEFRRLFGWLSLALALPVLVYSAADYWRAAWLCVRRRLLTIDFPIALGIAALYAQSAAEIVSGRGEGYLDSLAGLLFFLLCGKWFQRKTYDRLSFDRDYRAFFPLSVVRKAGGREETVSLSRLDVGDVLVLRHGELIPADAKLRAGAACIDYSFVTGESEPVARSAGDHLYAGGQQIGGAIEVEIVKPVSQSYLTSLWSHEAFRKNREDDLQSLINVFSRRFTRIVIGIAVAAAVYWAAVEPGRAVKAFTSVLIVACPCALALASPFTLGTALRVLARRNVFVKSPLALETLARTDAVVFDKTGTLTSSTAQGVRFEGEALDEAEAGWVAALTRQSVHPQAVRIGEFLGTGRPLAATGSFRETPGCGIEGEVAGRTMLLGSRAWLESRGVLVPELPRARGSTVCLALDGRYRGVFVLAHTVRPETPRLIRRLAGRYELALLSGDNEQARAQFRALFGDGASLRFNQSPWHKLDFIRQLQQSGRTVMMVGDGLNDAGALKQSDVGVAVVENIGAFSPASDVILEAGLVPRLAEVLQFARRSVRIVRLSFLISTLYNAIGISIAASGRLAPIVCAILMPLSSVTVVAFACGMTRWAGRRLRWEGNRTNHEPGLVRGGVSPLSPAPGSATGAGAVAHAETSGPPGLAAESEACV